MKIKKKDMRRACRDYGIEGYADDLWALLKPKPRKPVMHFNLAGGQSVDPFFMLDPGERLAILKELLQ